MSFRLLIYWGGWEEGFVALKKFGSSLPSHRNLFHYARRLFLPLRRDDETSGEGGGFGGNAGRDGGNRNDFDQREGRLEISKFYSFIRFDYIPTFTHVLTLSYLCRLDFPFDPS